MYRVLKLKESETKEFRYITTHGIGPGTLPNGTYIRSEDLKNGKTAIYLNRPLSDKELKKYDIRPEWIQEKEESALDRYQVREFNGPGAKFGVYDTKEKKFVQKGSKYVMIAACKDLNNKKLTEAEDSEEDAEKEAVLREIADTALETLKGNQELIDKCYGPDAENTEDYYNFMKDTCDLLNIDYDLIPDIEKGYIDQIIINVLFPSKKLTEAEDDEEDVEEIEDDIQDAEETEEDLEDTVDSEEDQEENPVEEDNLLDTQLDEIREVLVDLDLRLYKIMNDEEEFYIIGRLDPTSNQVEMLVDTQPADTMEVDIEPNGTETAEQTVEKTDDANLPEETDIATRFDYVKLPTKIEQIKEMFPRYGEDLTPDHEAIMEYLMNLLIEQNPRAAKEKAEETPDEEVPVDEEIISQEEIPGEEEIEDED